MTRMGLAGEEVTERTAFFFFLYDWKTREKIAFTNDEEFIPAANDKEWVRLYRISARLPVPTHADQREEIQLSGITEYDESLVRDPSVTLKHQIARGFFADSVRACPEISPHNPMQASWCGDVHDGESSSFLLTTGGKTYKVAVTEVDNGL